MKFPLAFFLFIFVSCRIPQEYLNDPGHFGEDSNYGSRQKMHKEAEDAARILDPTEKLDPEDDLYYYFSLHDHNNDGFLDGHELKSAFYLPSDGSVSLQDVESMIDHVLKEDDRDGDGTISWEEYLQSQKYHEKV